MPLQKSALLSLFLLFWGLCNSTLYAQGTEDCNVDANIINTNNSKNFTYCNFNSAGSVSIRFDIENASSTKSTNKSYHIAWGDGKESTFGSDFEKVSHTYTKSGSFDLVLTVVGENNCTSKQRKTVFIGSNPGIGLGNSGSSIDCAPATFTFDVTRFEGNSEYTVYTFQFDDGTAPITLTHQELLKNPKIVHTFNESSQNKSNGFKLTATARNQCSSSEATWTGIRISKGPVADISASTLNGCVNQPIKFQDISKSGYDASSNITDHTSKWEISPATGWTMKEGDDVIKTPSVVFTEPGQYIVKLTVAPEDPNSTCQGSSKEIIINIASLPTANFSLAQNPENGCANNLVTATNQSTGDNISFTWSVTPTTGWSFTNGTNKNSKDPQFNFTAAGEYKILLTTTNRCQSSTANKTITVKGKPVTTLPAAQQYCGPQIINFNQATTKHTPAYDAKLGTITGYNWEVKVLNGEGEFSFENGTSNQDQYPSINFKKPATYEVWVYAINECGVTSAPAKQKVTINPIPEISIAAAKPAICVGESTTLTASGADKYIWKTADGLSATSGSKVTINPTQTTTYTVTGTNTSTGCSNTQTITIVVNPLPTITVNSSTPEICFQQGSATLTASGANSYTWSPAAGLSATEGDVVTASPSQTTTYTVTGYNTETGCSNTATITIKVNPLPVVNAGEDKVTCDEPTPVQLTGSPAGGVWSGEHVSADGKFVPDGKGSFILTYTYTDAKGCTNSDQMTMTVTEVFVANAGDDKEVCLNSGAFILEGNPSAGLWSGSEFVTEDGTFTPKKVGTFTLTYTYYTGTCFTTDEMQVTVKPLPAAPVISGNNDICYNTSTTLSVNSTDEVKWYTTNAGGAPIFTGTSFETGNLTRTTDYYAEVTAQNGCTGPRTKITVVVRPEIAAPVVKPYVMCGPGQAILVAEGSASTYNWYDKEGNLVETNKTFTTPTLAETTIYYAEGVIGECVGSRTAVEVTILPVLDENIIYGATTICSGHTPNKLTGSKPKGGNGIYTYRWEISTTNATTGFTVINGAHNDTYQPGALTNPTWYRRVVMSAGCELASEAIQIAVTPDISNNTLLSVPTLCAGDIPNTISGSEPNGGNGSYTFRWEYSTDEVNYTAIDNSNIKDLEFKQPLNKSTWYRRIVISGTCYENISAAVKVTVLPKIAANKLTPTEQVVCYDTKPASITGAQPTGGNNSYTYLWEYSTDGNEFKKAPGTNSNLSYQPQALTQTTWFRRKVTSGACYDYSDPVKVVVNEVIAGNNISESQAICTDTAPNELVGQQPTGGNGIYTYVWEYSTTNAPGSFKPVAQGGGNANYKPGILTTTTYFRRIVTSGACVLTSNVVEIIVSPIINRNTIVLSQTIYAGQVPATLTGSTPAGGNEVYKYLWEYSEDGQNFMPAAEPNTGKNYSPQALFKDTWFRRVVYSGGCEHISDPVKITITPAIANNLIQADQIICYNNKPATITGNAPTGGYGDYEYLWQSSIQGPDRGWVTAKGTNNAQNYSPQTLTQTTWFRRLVISNTKTDESAAVMITVKAAMSNNIISTNQTVCFDVAPSTLKGSLPKGGSGNYTYLWEYSTEGPDRGFATAPGANNQQDYNPRALRQNTWFRRVVTSESCEALISNAILITITSLPTAPVVSNVVSCGGQAATLTAKGNGGRLEWYNSASGGTLLHTGSTFVTPALYTSTTYYVQEVNSCTGPRQEVTVNVMDITANAGHDVAIVKGRSAELNASGGTSYTWSPAIGLSNPNIANPVATPEETTTYKVTVVTNGGCTFTDQVTVTVLPFVDIPNTFTPNHDGTNDTWRIANINEYPNCKVQVFNQWGNLVYSSIGYGEPWDGRSSNGQELPIATYYYIIHLAPNEKPISGSITIVK